ncbi:MAG: primosomal protein N' [Alphaproteobacteria bacterium]
MPPLDATTTKEAVLSGEISVLLPLPLSGAYDYRVDGDLSLRPGDFVVVPLGPRLVYGVVWGPPKGDVDPEKLKPIAERLDAPPMPEVLRRFVDWVAAYTLAAPGSVLRMAMSVPAALEPPAPRRAYAAVSLPQEIRMTPARRRVLEVLAGGPPRPGGELAREAGVSAGVIKGLVDAGAVHPVDLPPPPFPVPDPTRPGPSLTPDQRMAANRLMEKARAGGFSVTLLDGVTGSGKTEVYFEAIAAALEAGRQILVLLPEIALTPRLLSRFEDRFGAPPALWHSDVGQLRRRATWRAVAAGEARVVVGARSALYLPYAGLGLIVVDEEHEAAFKQEDGVTYHARDMAAVRARLGEFPLVLASATPSLETVVNVERGRYARLQLRERYAEAALPRIEVVDLRVDRPPRGRFLSPALCEALLGVLDENEQALLFLNRRGYAPLTLCRACGHRLQCPSCTAWLVEHRYRRRLQCHHCGHQGPQPPRCPACEEAGTFVACGPGVERVAEEVWELAPSAGIAIMTSDTVGGPEAAAELVRAVEEREVDVLVGTQMIAKGHHFPTLTLVGIVDADLGLRGGDLRAAERTYQVLHQVAGRAGRAERPGRVLLQTHVPEHPVMQALASGDRDGFIALETDARQEGGWPPFGRLAALVVSGRDATAVDRVAGDLGRAAPGGPGVEVLGPAPAPMAVLRGRHRRRLLLKAHRGVALQAVVRAWLDRARVPGNVRVQVDVDPYSFL